MLLLKKNPKHGPCTFAGLLAFALTAALSTATWSVTPLASFYVYLQAESMTSMSPEFQPHAIRTAYPPLVQSTAYPRSYPIGFLLPVGYVDLARTQLFVRRYWRAASDSPSCRDYPTQLVVPSGVVSDMTLVDEATWHYPQSSRCSAEGFGVDVPNVALSARDEITFRAPSRRIALDGGQYDASPMTIVRNGVPGATYHCGDRLGLVATESNWDDANRAKAPELANWPARLSKDDIFELTTLPPPWIEDDVVEYVNSHDFPAQPGGQFFYAVLAAAKATLDALPVWTRTGNAFKSGGYVSACRFYGGKNGGPNTHLYTADDKECEALKQYPSLSYEGQTFAVYVPIKAPATAATATCPAASKPLYRLYNNAAASNGKFVSNHRYVTERSDVNAAVAQGWLDESTVMCVRQ